MTARLKSHASRRSSAKRAAFRSRVSQRSSGRGRPHIPKRRIQARRVALVPGVSSRKSFHEIHRDERTARAVKEVHFSHDHVADDHFVDLLRPPCRSFGAKKLVEVQIPALRVESLDALGTRGGNARRALATKRWWHVLGAMMAPT